MKTAKKSFADIYHDIWKQAREDYNNTPWYKFKIRGRLQRRARWAQYHYNKLTKNKTKKSCQKHKME